MRVTSRVRPISRIGLIGDVHCEDLALAQALAQLQTLDVDVIACVGDLVDGQGDADRCCDLLAAANVEVVAGNHDRWLLENKHRNWPGATASLSPVARRYLQNLPTVRTYATRLGILLVGHGIGRDDTAQLRFDTPPQDVGALAQLEDYAHLRCVVGGHTHEPMVRHIGALTFVNAGTLRHTRVRRFVMLDFDPPDSVPQFWQRHELDPTAPSIPVTDPTQPSREQCFGVTFYRQLDDHRFSVECCGLA